MTELPFRSYEFDTAYCSDLGKSDYGSSDMKLYMDIRQWGQSPDRLNPGFQVTLIQVRFSFFLGALVFDLRDTDLRGLFPPPFGFIFFLFLGTLKGYYG